MLVGFRQFPSTRTVLIAIGFLTLTLVTVSIAFLVFAFAAGVFPGRMATVWADGAGEPLESKPISFDYVSAEWECTRAVS